MTQSEEPLESYEEWLACFQRLKERPQDAEKLCQRMRQSVFRGVETPLLPVFQQRILECVNQMLDRTVARFSLHCQEVLNEGDVAMLDLLFNRLAKQIRLALFFRELEFLPDDFRQSTELSLRERMSEFWKNALRSLERNALENGGQPLEDALEAIRRIRLFPDSMRDASCGNGGTTSRNG